MLTSRNILHFLLLHLIRHLLFSKAEATVAGLSEGGRNVSCELFNSLEELSRIVDISYCVGNSGVREPFECLNHCDEFPGFELVTVSPL